MKHLTYQERCYIDNDPYAAWYPLKPFPYSFIQPNFGYDGMVDSAKLIIDSNDNAVLMVPGSGSSYYQLDVEEQKKFESYIL